MYYKKLIGKNIYLAPKNIEDAEKYVEWLMILELQTIQAKVEK